MSQEDYEQGTRNEAKPQQRAIFFPMFQRSPTGLWAALSRLSVYSTVNTLWSETPEFCFGKFCDGSSGLRHAQQKGNFWSSGILQGS